jgi:hypothetical protein
VASVTEPPSLLPTTLASRLIVGVPVIETLFYGRVFGFLGGLGFWGLSFLAVSLDAPRALLDQRAHGSRIRVGNAQLALIQACQDRIDLSVGEARRVDCNRTWRSVGNEGLRMLERDPRLAWQLDILIR